jgi:hypothetical protein
VKVRLKRSAPAAAAAVLCSALGQNAARAQDHIENAHAEHRRLSQPLEREIHAVAATGETTWIGYMVPAVPGSRVGCNAPVQLEAPKDVLLLLRVTGGAVDRLRLFAPSCSIDAGEMPLVWLDGVTPDASAEWLTGVATAAAASGDRNPALLSSALAGLEVTPGRAALSSLIAFARDDQHANVRSRAISSLAFRAETEAAATIQSAILNDPDTAVKRTAVGALARMPKDKGVPLLIQLARTNPNPAVRKQAMFWLGESKDPRAVSFFEEVLMK